MRAELLLSRGKKAAHRGKSEGQGKKGVRSSRTRDTRDSGHVTKPPEGASQTTQVFAKNSAKIFNSAPSQISSVNVLRKRKN